MSGKVDIGLLVANERSGTHLFRSLIASSKLVMAPGELCNAGGGLASADDFSFFSYRYNATLDNNTFIYPNIESTRELLDGYFYMLHNRGKQAGNRSGK